MTALLWFWGKKLLAGFGVLSDCPITVGFVTLIYCFITVIQPVKDHRPILMMVMVQPYNICASNNFL